MSYVTYFDPATRRAVGAYAGPPDHCPYPLDWPSAPGQWSSSYVLGDSGAPILTHTQEALLAHLADLRWQRETGGVEVAGHTIDTSREAQSLLMGAAFAAQMEGEGYEVKWKARDGWVLLTGPEITALARAVRAHVQAAFDAEASVAQQIEAGTITTLDALEAAWTASAP